jgi:hypothetical protein
VHEVIGGGRLPAYVRRQHDDLLDAVLDPGTVASRLVVLRGGSSTGKTRAAFEAVARGRLARWWLEYPLGEADLATLLQDEVRSGTVLWLGELRQYTSGQDGGAAVLGRLTRLLEGRGSVIAVTTMWPDQWQAYAEAARPRTGGGQDPAGTAGRLLARVAELTGRNPEAIDPARGGVIDIQSRSPLPRSSWLLAQMSNWPLLPRWRLMQDRTGNWPSIWQVSRICSTTTRALVATGTGRP